MSGAMLKAAAIFSLLVAPAAWVADVACKEQGASSPSLRPIGASGGIRAAPHEPTLSEKESFGFISEPDAAWNCRKRVHRKQMEVERSGRDMYGNINSGAFWWQAHYEPTFHCELEERVGLMGDGGKWVCNPRTLKEKIAAGAPCLVYSVGSAGDFSFEEAVKDKISKHCEVHVFDPAPEGTWTPPSNVTYHSIALGDGTNGKTLKQIVTELGHVGRKIDLFKIDCEGCEWTTYQHWLESGAELQQILVEMHWSGGVNAHGMFDHLLSNGYVVFNKEPNTSGCKGECIEYSLLRLDLAFSAGK